MTKSIRFALAAVIGASLTLAACGGDDDGGDDPTTAPADTADNGDTTTLPTVPGGTATGSAVSIEGFAFVIPAEVAAGSIAVTNADATTHTFTDDGGAFDVEVAASSSTVVEIAAGSYNVHCSIHTSMTGTLTVV